MTADERTPFVTGPDWTGLPPRVVKCLTRASALDALDSHRQLQEEYLEWRTVRNRNGKIQRVELTSELPDYWKVLATHHPERTLELVSEFTGRSVAPRNLYGIDNPLSVDPETRGNAFSATMMNRPNPLNDGREGICFMSQRSNNLGALVKLVAAALVPRTANGRPASAKEAIPLMGDAAVEGRASDPVLVERLGRLALEGRFVALDNPVGVYIQGVQLDRLRTPDGALVPTEWFRVSRGIPVERSSDGISRQQRLVLEVPMSERLVVSDLIDAATESPIRHGAQIAELVQLRTPLRTSTAGAAGSQPAQEVGGFRLDKPQSDPCRDIMRIAANT